MEKKYLYKSCALCKEPKEPNRSPYCKPCSKEYGKKYRQVQKLKPNVSMDGLGKFIDRIKKNDYDISFNDILIILFFYEIITKNINEYDQFSSGKQIKLMWDKINLYYNKRVKDKNNI